MPDLAVAGVVAAGDLAVDVGERLPQVVAGVRQPQVQVVVGGQRVEQFDLGAGQPGVTEQRDAARGRSVGDSCSVTSGFRVPDVRWVGVDAVQQRAPQVRLPVEVGVEAVRRHRPPSRRAAAAAAARRRRRGRPVGARRRSAGPSAVRFSSPASKCPRWVASVLHQSVVAAVVDDVEQRPDERVGMPRVVVVGPGDLGDERARVAERDACADAVLSGPAAEDVRQPLAQPPLDALGRDDDELLGEGVGQRIGEQGTEAVGQQVGPLSAVEMKAIGRQTTTALSPPSTSRLSSPTTRPSSSTIQLSNPRLRYASSRLS